MTDTDHYRYRQSDPHLAHYGVFDLDDVLLGSVRVQGGAWTASGPDGSLVGRGYRTRLAAANALALEHALAAALAREETP